MAGQPPQPITTTQVPDSVLERMVLQLERIGNLSTPSPSGYAPAIINLPLPNGNTEYTYQLPRHTKRFSIAMRQATELKISFFPDVVVEGGKPYKTIKANTEWNEDNLDIQGDIRLFMAYVGGAAENKVAEITLWV